MKNILKQTYSLLCFQVILLVKQQASKLLRGKWQCTVKNNPWVLHTVLSPSDKQVKSMSASLPSFLQTSPVVWYCVVVLISSPLKKHKKKNGSRGWFGRCPVHVWGYTPSSMPIKSEPFCIVMEAPAALSTNIEVYCPACRGKIHNSDVERLNKYRYFMFVCFLACCSPVTPAALERWQWISCCYFLIQQSSPVSCNHIKKRHFWINIVFSTIHLKYAFFNTLLQWTKRPYFEGIVRHLEKYSYLLSQMRRLQSRWLN